jgi:hypothetical protein
MYRTNETRIRPREGNRNGKRNSLPIVDANGEHFTRNGLFFTAIGGQVTL